MYNTYRFKDKDPIIDVLRTLLEIEASLRGLNFGQTMRRVAEESGVSYFTLWSWFYGPTRFPRFAGVAAVAAACGKEVSFGVLKRRFPRAVA